VIGFISFQSYQSIRVKAVTENSKNAINVSADETNRSKNSKTVSAVQLILVTARQSGEIPDEELFLLLHLRTGVCRKVEQYIPDRTYA